MNPKQKLEIVPSIHRETAPTSLDAFHEEHVRRDLARFAETPGIFAKYVERARSRFFKAGERAILEHWIAFYEDGQRLIAAKTEMERRKSEYSQLGNEHEIELMEKQVSIAKAEADIEEQKLRRDKAAYQRLHVGDSLAIETPSAASEDERKLNEATQRRQMDARWELQESLRASTTMIELQHWRHEQRDRILKDRKLTPEEQSEDLQLVDDLYRKKSGELKMDTGVFEEDL